MAIALMAVVVLIAAVVAIYLLLKDMGENGVEVAAPGSCKSGTCGVRCRQAPESSEPELSIADVMNEPVSLDQQRSIAAPDSHPRQ